MKKIIYTLAVLMGTQFLTSCEDFLDKTPFDRVDPQTNVTDDVAVAMANACYIPLRSSNLYNQRIWGLDIVAILILVAPVRRDAQDGIGQAGVLVFLQGDLVGQVPDCNDF